MTALVLSAAEYTELIRQHHTNPEGPAVLTSRGEMCWYHADDLTLGDEEDECVCGQFPPSRWATSSPTTCPECKGSGRVESDYWDLNDPDNHLGWVPCPACGGSGATRTIELRTTCPSNDCENGRLWDDRDMACPTCGGGGTVLVGRAASCEVLPIYASDDLPEDYRNTIEVNPYGEVWHHPAVVNPFHRYGLVLDPLPSPGDYALIITGYTPTPPNGGSVQ